MNENATVTPELALLRRLLAQRHSCRAFLPTPLPRARIEAWMDTARLTASWCNTQPWQLVLAEGEATRRLSDALVQAVTEGRPTSGDFEFPGEYSEGSLRRRRAVGAQLYESLGIARGDREAAARQMLENFRFFGAPQVAVLTTDRVLGTYGAIDCGAFLGSLLMAAEACGIACIAQGALAQHAAVLHRVLDIPPDRAVVCGIAFGIEDQAHAANAFRAPREDLPALLRWVD